MPSIKKIVIAVFLAFAVISVAQTAKSQVPDEIILSLQSGNVKVLAEYFNQNVELVVLDNDNVYSKAQAEQIVTNFFNNNRPEGFAVIHNGGKEGAKYVIGNLTTNNGTFRVYFLLKHNGGKDYIHQLRIEKQ
ncbi:MAG: DUF4783 domain-containing protein [Prolixibacteraceae bacterium]